MNAAISPLHLNYLASRAALAWVIHQMPDDELQAVIDRTGDKYIHPVWVGSDVANLRKALQGPIAEALSTARKYIKGTQAYSKWCEDNGLGDIPARDRTEWKSAYEVGFLFGGTNYLDDLSRDLTASEQA